MLRMGESALAPDQRQQRADDQGTKEDPQGAGQGIAQHGGALCSQGGLEAADVIAAGEQPSYLGL